ncbi:hypothetical protein TWF481_002464 [Arthrobotrys musiformis]|uniref:Uncharacterized protein n=1 Tax=Arthrobotrys musiformis TaxID=47236 RepID=A0AAV9VVN7_9PEZI
MPSKPGPVRPKRAGKKAGMSLEEVLKIEKIRSSAPLQIMDGLKAQRGRPRRQWPNPVTRLNPYEDVPMVVNPQTTAEPEIKTKPNSSFPPLKIVIEPTPGTKRSRKNISLSNIDQKPKRVKGARVYDHDEAVAPARSLKAGLPHHLTIPHGYSHGYEDIRQTSKSPSEASDISTASGSYPSTPLSSHYTATTPALMSPPAFYHSPSEVNGPMGVHSLSLPPLIASPASAPWMTLPTPHQQHEYGRIETPSWAWTPPGYYPHSYGSTDGYQY